MPDKPEANLRLMIMRSFLAQSGARSTSVAMMMLQREYPEATEDERRAAIAASQAGAAQP